MNKYYSMLIYFANGYNSLQRFLRDKKSYVQLIAKIPIMSSPSKKTEEAGLIDKIDNILIYAYEDKKNDKNCLLVVYHKEKDRESQVERFIGRVVAYDSHIPISIIKEFIWFMLDIEYYPFGRYQSADDTIIYRWVWVTLL